MSVMSDGKPGKDSNSASGEVPAKATRRSFTREYKLRIVREADAASKDGGIGEILRREGLYSSTLAAWREAFPRDGEVSLEPVKRGPKPRFTAEQKAMQKLQRENARLRKKLELTEALLDLQKKTLVMLESLEPKEGGE